MNLFIPAGRGLGEDELFVSYSEVGAKVDAIRRSAHAAGRTFFWYSPTPYCLYNPVARGLGNKSCAAADGLVHVNPRGRSCLPSWPEALGSLLERLFEDIWFSDGRLTSSASARSASLRILRQLRGLPRSLPSMGLRRRGRIGREGVMSDDFRYFRLDRL